MPNKGRRKSRSASATDSEPEPEVPTFILVSDSDDSEDEAHGLPGKPPLFSYCSSMPMCPFQDNKDATDCSTSTASPTKDNLSDDGQYGWDDGSGTISRY